MKRSATVAWFGSGKNGTGNITTESLVLNEAKFSFVGRFTVSNDTNPEELIAAAHVCCFAMKLSFVLGESGFIPDKIETKATINFEHGTAITEAHLMVKAKVPGISDYIFQECVNNAESNCPVSNVLNTRITVESELEE